MTMREGIKLARDIMARKPFADVLGAEVLPAPRSRPMPRSKTRSASSAARVATGVAAPFPTFSTALGGLSHCCPSPERFLQYTGITVVKQNGGHSNYNSLQARLQRQFRNGFSMLTSFTYAKQMSNAEDEIGQFNDGPPCHALKQGSATAIYPVRPD